MIFCEVFFGSQTPLSDNKKLNSGQWNSAIQSVREIIAADIWNGNSKSSLFIIQ